MTSPFSSCCLRLSPWSFFDDIWTFSSSCSFWIFGCYVMLSVLCLFFELAMHFFLVSNFGAWFILHVCVARVQGRKQKHLPCTCNTRLLFSLIDTIGGLSIFGPRLHYFAIFLRDSVGSLAVCCSRWLPRQIHLLRMLAVVPSTKIKIRIATHLVVHNSMAMVNKIMVSSRIQMVFRTMVAYT